MILAVVLLAVVTLLTPLLAGVPDGTPNWGLRFAPGLAAVWNYPDWPAVLCVLSIVAVGAVLWKSRGAISRAETAFFVLLAIALASVVVRLLVDRSIAYLGPMLRQWMVLATECAVFALARRTALVGRAPRLTLLLTAVFAAAVVSDVGVNEYLLHRHDPGGAWRIFATSTPDFLAGYLVLLLPPTLALFVAVPIQRQERPLVSVALAVLLIVVFALEAMTLFRTQSRFALVSVAVGFLVFLLAFWRARRAGMALERSSLGRLAGLGVLVVLLGGALARPVLLRVAHTSTGDNSTAFRLYTWRGSAHMAAENPVVGTGLGTYADIYPRYAITGFARLAHNSYLQMADECGIPGVIALVTVLGMVLGALWKGLDRANTSEAPLNVFLSAVAPADDRILLCGLLGGLSASIVQNLIDSDWYVFFLGLTFWILAGLSLGWTEAADPVPDAAPASPRWHRLARPMAALLGVVIFLRMGMLSIAATYEAQAVVAGPDPASTPLAEEGWAEAGHWDPLNARYASYLGYRVYDLRENNLPAAEAQMRRAVSLEPTSLNWSTLATVLSQQHRYPEAIAALQEGLRVDPHSDTALEMRLSLSQLLPPPQSVDYCRQITQIEDGPAGKVRAIGDIVPTPFPIANACVADAAYLQNQTVEASTYYQRAEKDLEEYADEGGTTDIQRQVLIGDHPDPNLDKRMWDLYSHVMERLSALSPPSERGALNARSQDYAKRFSAVFAQASQPGNV